MNGPAKKRRFGVHVHQEDVVFRSFIRKPEVEGVHLYTAPPARIAEGFPKAELARISFPVIREHRIAERFFAPWPLAAALAISVLLAVAQLWQAPLARWLARREPGE